MWPQNLQRTHNGCIIEMHSVCYIYGFIKLFSVSVYVALVLWGGVVVVHKQSQLVLAIHKKAW